MLLTSLYNIAGCQLLTPALLPNDSVLIFLKPFYFSEFVLKSFLNNAKRLDTGQVSLSQVSKSALL